VIAALATNAPCNVRLTATAALLMPLRLFSTAFSARSVAFCAVMSKWTE